jgi:endoglucanase
MMGYTSLWSTPGGILPPVLPRAHYLTGQQRYLAGTIAACQYSGGANPMNMSYTTGIGPRQPLAPLHIDSRVSGQRPPAGITVYGQSDPSMGYSFDSFAHTWFLNRYGGVHSTNWPTAEAYIDLGTWPAMNEYTVHQTFSPTSYTWGYLAARGDCPEGTR